MDKRQVSRWIAWPAAIVLLLIATVPFAVGSEPSRLDPRLLEEFAAAPGEVDFMVFLNVEADLRAAPAMEGRTERGQYVYQTLRAVADQSQHRLRADLEALDVPYHSFFIVNALRVTGDEALARKLAARPEVARVVADPAFNGLDDPPPEPAAPEAIESVEWGIERVNADDAWALGYTGQNIVVASCDTGVEWEHEALVNQYRGGEDDHDYNWYDAFYEYSIPTDPHGHGTHTTGTMVGDDGDANQIGMAPGAEWIACKVSSGSVWKASKYIECWEWFLAPTRVDGTDPDPSKAPHIINNSWSCPAIEGCDEETLHDAARALYAAGIAIIKSAGNSGPSCSTITNPDYIELLSIGAFDRHDNIANFSSRGPVVRDGETIIKPDVAAPGVNVRSSVPGGDYDNYATMSGTSMAAPHTAGLVALLWSAQPSLIGDLEATFQIVKSSAEPTYSTQCPPNLPSGRPNNVWGWGIIDALAAVQAATDTGLGVLNGTITEQGTGTPLDGVEVEIVQAGNGLDRVVTTEPDGTYSETLLAATYDVTATLYGYLPGNGTGIAVTSDAIATFDLALDPAQQWNVSGTVAEQGSGMPLWATLTLLDTPVETGTDPDTGEYDMAVSEGSYLLRASSPGYVPQETAIAVGSDLIVDFELAPEMTYYVRDSLDPCGPAFDWIDITGTGTPYPLSDDANEVVSLGAHSFDFYGTSYSALYLGSNGYVTFGSGSDYPGGNTIPSTFPPNNAIYAFWDDLNPAGGAQGTIYTQLVDDHLYVIEFHQVQHWPDGDPETFEIILDLDTGAILLQYQVVSNTNWTSVGLENSTGTSGVSYAFHDPSVPTDGLAVAFYPTFGAPPPAAEPGQIVGTVTDMDTSDPIDGATVTAVALASGRVFSYTADATGVYTAPLCPGWHTLAATAPSYLPSAPVQVEVITGTETVQDFELEHGGADYYIYLPIVMSGSG